MPSPLLVLTGTGAPEWLHAASYEFCQLYEATAHGDGTVLLVPYETLQADRVFVLKRVMNFLGVGVRRSDAELARALQNEERLRAAYGVPIATGVPIGVGLIGAALGGGYAG